MPATYTTAHKKTKNMQWLNILFEKHLFEEEEDLKVRSKEFLFNKCGVLYKISLEKGRLKRILKKHIAKRTKNFWKRCRNRTKSEAPIKRKNNEI